jgi:hypothetical protein
MLHSIRYSYNLVVVKKEEGCRNSERHALDISGHRFSARSLAHYDKFHEHILMARWPSRIHSLDSRPSSRVRPRIDLAFKTHKIKVFFAVSSGQAGPILSFSRLTHPSAHSFDGFRRTRLLGLISLQTPDVPWGFALSLTMTECSLQKEHPGDIGTRGALIATVGVTSSSFA